MCVCVCVCVSQSLLSIPPFLSSYCSPPIPDEVAIEEDEETTPLPTIITTIVTMTTDLHGATDPIPDPQGTVGVSHLSLKSVSIIAEGFVQYYTYLIILQCSIRLRVVFVFTFHAYVHTQR